MAKKWFIYIWFTLQNMSLNDISFPLHLQEHFKHCDNSFSWHHINPFSRIRVYLVSIPVANVLETNDQLKQEAHHHKHIILLWTVVLLQGYLWQPVSTGNTSKCFYWNDKRIRNNVSDARHSFKLLYTGQWVGNKC